MVRAGDVVGERFEIEREIAAGGMGRVHRARDRVRGGEVALKIALRQDDEAQRRFAREATVLAEITHPAIVRYVAHGQTPEGEPFLAMEWLDGEDLAEVLRRQRGSLGAGRVLALGRRVAGGLAALHGRALVHRDVKPSNVFLPGGDVARAKLLDLGLVRSEGPAPDLTMTGTVVGTPSYMAPEQVRGQRELDARVDVWALGCVLYECVTGGPPFRGERAMAVLAKILFDEAPRMSELVTNVPPELDELVARMLAKAPGDRPRDAAEVERALDAIDEETVGSWREVPAAVPISIGTAEQRVYSVLVAGVSRGERGAHGEETTFEGRIHEALKGFGGRFESLADGSLLVLFDGARVASDQAARAARAALAVRALDPDTPLAIVTGRAEARAKHAVGELLDRAANALAKAEGAAIGIDEMTAGLLEGRFELARDGGEARLVGRSEQRARTLLGRPSPWVGREREVATIESILAECVSEPVARAVLVTGPAGAGKSRLRHELAARLRSRGEEVEVLFSQGDSLSAGSPFVMLGPAIRRSAEILDGEPLEVRRDKLRARVARHVPPAERARVAEFLGELAQTPFPDEDREALRAARRDPMLMGDAMRSAFETFLAAECAAHPVLLVLEDLHWGDLPSVKFIDAALRTLREQPLFVLATARPEVSQTFPGLWGERGLIEVRLDALSRKASERLIRSVLGPAVAAETVELVVRRAEGNAFFLEEMIRAVASAGTVGLPDTVLGVLQARLDALGADAKRVLRAGSVFGEVLWEGGVNALLGETSAVEWLDDLVAREIIARRPSSRIPGEKELAFRHALVRDAAYAMLTDQDRVVGHRLAAEWLEGRGELDALVLAEHWARGESPDRARGWFRRAAEQALEGNDLAAAVEHAERAVLCNAEGETLGALRALQATACYWQSDYARAQAFGREAAGLVMSGSATWFRALGEAIVASARRGQPEEVDRFVGRAIFTAAREGALGPQIVCLCRGTFQLIFAGRFEQADRLLARITELAGDVDALAPAVAAQVHHVRGVRAAHAGHVGDFMAHLERALASFEHAGDSRNVALERPTLGWCYAELGDLGRAEATLRSAADACERLGVMQTKTYALVNLGYVLGLRGAVDEARATQVAAAESCRAQGNARLEGWSRAHLSTLELGAGDAAAAEREAGAAVRVLGASPGLRAWAEAALARALLARGDLAAADASSGAAYDTLLALGSVLQCESLIPLVRAEVLGAAGRAEERAAVVRYAQARLRARADRLAPALREGFLSLPDSRATLALAETA